MPQKKILQNKKESENWASSLILASASRSRRRMLEDAGVFCRFEAADLDEASIKNTMIARGARPAEISEKLAIEKALLISQRHPENIILGADQLLVCEGKIFDKARNLKEAKDHLLFFRGKSHSLYTSYALVKDQKILFCETVCPQLTMRNFSAEFLEDYLDKSDEEILNSVGCYFLEDKGSQLFSDINGNYFAILGLPLLNVMDSLRRLKCLKI